jgi:acetyltransferase
MPAPAVLDSLPEVARGPQHPLDVFFAPQSVAVFGATETPGSAGRALMANLIKSPFGGTIYPIDPSRTGTLGIRAYPRLADVPESIELAMIVTPAPTVPDILGECAAAGVRGAIVLSAGLGEAGPAGSDLERRLRDGVGHTPMRVVGPNCLGIACPHTGLNATFAPAIPRVGNIGFLSQSGALLTALLPWSESSGCGCSAFVSVGSLVDVDWAEWLDYLAQDAPTRCIAVYAETIADPRSFFTAARRVAPHKPILLIKGGQPERNEVFDEACRSTGVLRVGKIADLFCMAEVLTVQPAAQGRRLTILSNARGPAVLAADALRASGGRLAELAPVTVAALDGLLGRCWNCQNPIDVGDDAGPQRFAQAARLASLDPGTDALLVLLAPHAAIDANQVAEQVAALAAVRSKPVLACWLWGAGSLDGVMPLRQAGIPTFYSLEAAVRAFSYLWQHGENLRWLRQLTDALQDPVVRVSRCEEGRPDRDRATAAIGSARRAHRTLLTEAETADLLAAYCLPMIESRVVTAEEQAVAAATALGFPVIMGLDGQSVLLSGEGAAVRLHVADEAGVRRAWQTLALIDRAHPGQPQHSALITIRSLIGRAGHEIAVSSTTDPQIGPVLEVSAHRSWPTGGAANRCVVLPPLSPRLIREMIEQESPFAAIRDRAGETEAIDLALLEQFFGRFNQLVVEQRWVKEIHLEVLLVSPERVVVLAARVMLHEPHTSEDQLPAPVLSQG